MMGRAARFVNDKARLLTALVLIPALISLFAEAHWLLELTTHFQAHYLVAFGLTLLVLLLFRDWRWSAVAAVGAILSGSAVIPWYFGGPSSPPATGGTPLRIFFSNVYTANSEFGRVLALARDERIDLAVLQEIDARWVAELEPLSVLLPQGKTIPRSDNFGIGLWSRFPLANVQEVASGPFEVPTISAEVEVGGRKLLVIATHPVPPASAEGAQARNAQLEELAAVAAQATMPVILIGDLNVTMWSPFYRRLEKTSRLRNVRRGFGILPTWPAQLRGLGIPLDHCLADPSLQVGRVSIGAAIGSDHLPLIVELLVPPGK